MGSVLYTRKVSYEFFALDKPSRFQTLCSNATRKRPPSILFLGLLDTSKISAISLTVILAVAGMTGDVYSGFLGQLRQARSGRGERDTSDGGSAPRSLHACLRSPEKRQKITPVIQAITPGQRLKVEFMKKIEK